jgi:hypothetical protein
VAIRRRIASAQASTGEIASEAMRKLSLGAAIVLAIACADSGKDSSATKADSSKTVTAQGVAAVDSAARQNTNFEPARTPAVLTRETFQFDSAMVDSAATYALSLDELRLLRGLVFGRHGRRFGDDAFIQSYLESQSWYVADSGFTNDRLNDMERRNLDIIRGAEATKHDRIMPGDLRYHRVGAITVAMLGEHTRPEWELLQTEIPAMHGEYFVWEDCGMSEEECKSEIQNYYEDRYWYRRDTAYRPASLTALEQATLDTIRLATMLDRKHSVAPGMMHLFQGIAMVPEALRGVSLHDLRLLRNEVFARHGRRFTTPWLRDHFQNYPWYTPRADFDIKELSEIERANIALITQREAEMHDELSTRELGPNYFFGLYLEDAARLRNEIFARHGRTFKDRKLQAYFASLPWYRPNPAYADSLLTPIERKNIASLVEYEEMARRGQRYPAA